MSDAPQPASAREALITEAPLSDRLNPVFVRELTQSLKSRVFGINLYVSLLVIVILGIYFAGLATDTLSDEPKGRAAFSAVLSVLTPILILIVPAQAFYSTVKEVQGGAAELLFLSRITPFGLIRGKLFAALSQSLLYLSLFAPTLALTFLLRGVDVKMIGFAIVLAALASLVCTSFAVAAGTLARFRPITALVAGVTIIALGLAMIFSWGFVAFGIRNLIDPSTPWLEVSGVIALLTSFSIALFSVIGCTMLKHPYENRSTSIRMFVFVLFVAIFGAMEWLAPARTHETDIRGAAMLCAAIGSIFFLFAATEDRDLSPRVRTQVPRNPLLALLAAPFLPGRGRGLLFTYVMVLALAAVLAFGPTLSSATGGTVSATTYSYREKQFEEMGWYGFAFLLYCVYYSALGAIVRNLMKPGTAKNWQARLLWLSLALLGMILPAIAIIVTKSRIGSWNPSHILNPFWTLDDGLDNAAEAMRTLGVLGTVAGVLALISLPTILRGVREVLDASRERREREATVAPTIESNATA